MLWKTWYYFQVGDLYQYVAMDANSGGYPYYTDDPNAVQFWRTPEAANNYKQSFLTATNHNSKDWILHAVDLTTGVVETSPRS